MTTNLSDELHNFREVLFFLENFFELKREKKNLKNFKSPEVSEREKRAHLCSVSCEVGKVLVVKLVQCSHVLAEADEPVNGREVLALRQLLVQTPEHLYDAESGGRYWVREVTARGRNTTKRAK